MANTSSITLGIGVFLSVCLAAIAIADQITLGWTRADVVAHYGSFGRNPDPRILTAVLAVSFGCAAVFLATAMIATIKGWNLTALILVILVVVASVGFALLTTFAAEFEGYVLITFWRFVPWLVPVVALVSIPSLFIVHK